MLCAKIIEDRIRTSGIMKYQLRQKRYEIRKFESLNSLLFRFPENSSQKEKWVRFLEIDEEISSKAKLCHLHFASNAYKTFALRGNSMKRTLKKGAVPSIIGSKREL